MKQTRTAKRREAGINSLKILLTSASLAATVGGWAVISASNGAPVSLAEVNSTATVQSFLDSRSATATPVTSTTTGASSNSSQASTANTTSTAASSSNANNALPAATATSAPIATATAAPTAVPTQVVVQRIIRTRTSR